MVEITCLPSRVAALEATLKDKQQLIESYHTEISALKESISLREGEIQRLSRQVEAGPQLDQLQLAFRAEAKEHIILQLNDQVLPC